MGSDYPQTGKRPQSKEQSPAMPPSREDLQAELLDRFYAGPVMGGGQTLTGNPTVCGVTGRHPTVVQSMTEDECRAALDALDTLQTKRLAKAQAEAEARQKAIDNERLRQSGRYGCLMADDD